jgi:hypothetical protein
VGALILFVFAIPTIETLDVISNAMRKGWINMEFMYHLPVQPQSVVAFDVTDVGDGNTTLSNPLTAENIAEDVLPAVICVT